MCCQVVEIDQGGQTLRSFGGDRGNAADQLNWPWYVIVDHTTDQCLIADRNNSRVVNLRSELRPSGVVISSPQGPSRLCLAGDRVLIAQNNCINIFTL